jgi:hypothetical protein
VVCQSSIGKQLRGSIIKMAVEPYEYTVEETGEVIEMDYRYTYSPQEEVIDEVQSVRTEPTLV